MGTEHTESRFFTIAATFGVFCTFSGPHPPTPSQTAASPIAFAPGAGGQSKARKAAPITQCLADDRRCAP